MYASWIGGISKYITFIYLIQIALHLKLALALVHAIVLGNVFVMTCTMEIPVAVSAVPTDLTFLLAHVCYSRQEGRE